MVAIVTQAAVLLLASTALVHTFWQQCGPLDVHAWPPHLLCWYLTEFIAGVAAFVGLIAGYAVRERGAAISALAAMIALAAFRLQGGFPLGSVPLTYTLMGLLFLVLPSIVGATVGSFLASKKNAPTQQTPPK